MSFLWIDNMIYRLVTAALNIQFYVDDQSGYTAALQLVWRRGKTQWLKSKVTSWLAVWLSIDQTPAWQKLHPQLPFLL